MKRPRAGRSATRPRRGTSRCYEPARRPRGCIRECRTNPAARPISRSAASVAPAPTPASIQSNPPAVADAGATEKETDGFTARAVHPTGAPNETGLLSGGNDPAPSKARVV